MSMDHVAQKVTVEEYELLIATGVLNEDDRVELIRGEVVEKMPIGDRHVGTVNRVNRLVGRWLGDRAIVSVQNPIVLAESEPEPDIALLQPRDDFYASGKPRAGDIFLVIEVADTSLAFDRDTKGPLYAEAGIPDYWILDLNDDVLLVHRRPQAEGRYGVVLTLGRGESLSPLAFPDLVIGVDDLLGPGQPA